MNIVPIRAFFDNYIWAIIDKNNQTFACIDPGEAKSVVQFAQANQLKLATILLTHHHHDHVGGVNELINEYPFCIVYGPHDARIPKITHEVFAQQTIQVGNFTFEILFNPGHTSSHISYYEPEKKWLFCGDTLFSAGCGRVFDGTLEQLYHSLTLFKSLPPTTKIFCAHEYTEQNLRFAQTVEPHNASIQTYLHKFQQNLISCSLPSNLYQELQINPFLRTDTSEVQKYALEHGALSNNPFEIFRILRERKNSFK